MSEYKEVPNFDGYNDGASFVSQPEILVKPEEPSVFTDKSKKVADQPGRGRQLEFIIFLHDFLRELPNDEVGLALCLKKLDQSTDPNDAERKKMMYDLSNIVPGLSKSFTYDDGVAMRAILDYKNSFNL